MSKNVKSILTTAMLNAKTADDEVIVTDAEGNESILEPTFPNRKKLFAKALIATAAAAIATAIIVKVTSTSDEDPNETTED